MNAYRLAGTASFGRGGILIAPGGRVIQESESNRDDSGRSFRRLNPNYWKRRYVADLTCRRKLPAPSKLHGRAAILNNYVANNFYHWMLEVGPKLTALDLAGIEVDHYVLDCHLPYQRRILQLLGVDLTRVIQPHCQSHLLADEIVWFNMPTTGVVQQYASAILKQLANNTPRESSRNRIYISRRDAVHRRLQNEREVERELGKLGVTSVCMSDLSIDEQIELFRDASLIVTIHGAALANLIFANPHLKIVEIVPESRMNRSLFPEWSRQLGLDHLLVYCQTSRFRQRLQVCVDDLLAAVEAHDACDARIRP